MSKTLHARKLNHGQSEIWLADENKSVTIATNAVVNAARKHCSNDSFEEFYSAMNVGIGNIAEVFAVDPMAQELGLLTS